MGLMVFLIFSCSIEYEKDMVIGQLRLVSYMQKSLQTHPAMLKDVLQRS